MRASVLIVGGGPVELTLAMDLAWRGIDVMVAERRPPNHPPNVKCGQFGARSMEIFRRFGLADKLRAIGLPADYPNNIVSATSITGIELSRVPILARGARGTPAAAGLDTIWPRPEHAHCCNQKFFEPVLFAHAVEQPRIRILYPTEISDLAQGKPGVTASAVKLMPARAQRSNATTSSDATRRARLCASRSAPSSSATRCSSTHNLSTSGHRNSGARCPASRPGSTSRSIRAAAA